MSYSTPQLLTEESRWLAKLVRFQRMAIHQAIKSQVQASASFTIGDGNSGTPTNGSTTYTNTALIGKSPQVFLDGIGFLNLGTDYSFNTSTGVVTLLASTFTTNQRYVILY